MMAKNPYQNLCGSLSQTAHNILYELQHHPAAKFVSISLIYNREYHLAHDKCGNLYVARTKAALITLAALDDVARTLRLMPANEATALPSDLIDDMLRSLGFAPDTQLVQKAVIHTRGANGLPRIPRTRKKSDLVAKKTETAPKVIINTEQVMNDPFNNLMHSFISKTRKESQNE